MRTGLMMLTLIGLWAVSAAGQPPAKLGPVPGPTLSSIDRPPTVRVRVAKGVDRVSLGGPAFIAVRSASDPTIDPVRLRTPVAVARQGQAFLLRDAAGAGMTWRLRSMRIDTPDGRPLTLDGTALPGRLVLHPVDVPIPSQPTRLTPRIDAVNHVDLEQYLPGVLARELYASWPEETFRAQAIAARSYALWERHRHQHRAHDLESTTASQAYVGLTQNPRANRAVAATRGTVLSHDGRVVPAFYCSAVGREAQDAAAVFADRTPPIDPLRGGPRGAWDQPSPHYRWPTWRRPIDDASARVRAWTKASQHPAASITRIARINTLLHVDGRQRPAGFVVHDTAGRSHRFTPVDLRLALNHTDPTLPALSHNAALKSSDCRFAVTGSVLVAQDGHGYGHGVGMSQWGAHAMANAGHDHRAILAHYYPGAALTRLYR